MLYCGKRLEFSKAHFSLSQINSSFPRQGFPGFPQSNPPNLVKARAKQQSVTKADNAFLDLLACRCPPPTSARCWIGFGGEIPQDVGGGGGGGVGFVMGDVEPSKRPWAWGMQDDAPKTTENFSKTQGTAPRETSSYGPQLSPSTGQSGTCCKAR